MCNYVSRSLLAGSDTDCTAPSPVIATVSFSAAAWLVVSKPEAVLLAVHCACLPCSFRPQIELLVLVICLILRAFEVELCFSCELNGLGA